ncbi:MAG: adenosylmethionine decarboxylase [Candidatus Dependentiae bacterium]|nr:adenosylmethionine decarboxylase [Candidatus Dependentiae bacterium]
MNPTYFFIRTFLFFSCIVTCPLLSQSPSLLPMHQTIAMESLDLRAIKECAGRSRLGHHLVIDLVGCNPEKIKHVEIVEQIMVKAAIAARATIVSHHFKQFEPFGVSGAIVLAESHLTIHTWPEVDGYCAIDIFTCGNTDNFAALEVLKQEFEAQECIVVDIERGKQKKIQG